jgi:glycosyltransferase involved in cell wall biosynthesis
MRESEPLISVLTPVFNGEKWIGEAIRSVLSQSVENFELLVVDDGSTDESAAIAERYSRQDPRVRLLKKPKSGLVDSLNWGLAAARGEWIARLDADDVAQEDRLESQLIVARSDSRIVLVGSGAFDINEAGIVEGVQLYPAAHAALLSSLKTRRRFFAHSSAFFKADAVRSLGGYRRRVTNAQDHDLWLRLSEIGMLCSVRKPLIKYRRHPLQISHQDGGRTQLVDAMVAHVSYWLRQAGRPDPVGGTDEEFARFREWIESSPHVSRILTRQRHIHDVRAKLFAQGNSLSSVASAGGSLIARPILTALHLRHRLIGDRSLREVAQKWSLQSI